MSFPPWGLWDIAPSYFFILIPLLCTQCLQHFELTPVACGWEWWLSFQGLAYKISHVWTSIFFPHVLARYYDAGRLRNHNLKVTELPAAWVLEWLWNRASSHWLGPSWALSLRKNGLILHQVQMNKIKFWNLLLLQFVSLPLQTVNTELPFKVISVIYGRT